MLVFDFEKFYKGLKKLKACEPLTEAEKEMYRIFVMLETGEIDYGSFNAATLEQLLKDYYYQDREDIIEEKLSGPDYIAERIKNAPGRAPDDNLFF